MRGLNRALTRRDLIRSSGAAGAGVGVAATLAACGSSSKGATTAGAAASKPRNPNDEYVFLSIVTEVPFWVDHKDAMSQFSKATGAKTQFVGPTSADPAAQAAQLDQLIQRKPAGILLFPADADALTPGIDRATEAGIPVITIISRAPKSRAMCHIGIDGVQDGMLGAAMLAKAIGGKGEVILGTFPSPNVLDRVKGYKQYFSQHHPDIKVVQVVNDKADPSYAPQAYSSALQSHPNVVGIGGTDGDSGVGAAQAVKELGRTDKIKIVAQDRNDDMLPLINQGAIEGTVVQKSWDEAWMACWMLYWLNHETWKPVPDWRGASINPLPELITTGIWPVTKDNVDQFFHKKR
jgi:ribose transport system substrate-binding protein